MAIQKLDRYIKTEENGVRISCPPEPQDMMDKINELVDAVNELQISANRMGFDKPKENKQDPYAEQPEVKENHKIRSTNERLRDALDKAKHRLRQIAYLNMSEHGIGSNGMMIDWCKTVAHEALKEINETIDKMFPAEQKDK